VTTYIGVETTQYQVEDRSWLLSPHGTEPGTTPSVTLDTSAFTAGTHYPNGYLPSGLVVGRITATGLYGPYDNSAVDGRQTAAGILFSSVKVPTSGGDPAGAIVVHGFVDADKLPIALDAAGVADLGLIHFA
jgi:hypothetical protein